MNKYYQFKYLIRYKVKDFIWANKYIFVPLGTAIASLIWYFLDSGPEPIVLVVSSLIATFVLKIEKSDAWYTKIQGDVYEIRSRSDLDSEKTRVKNAEKFISVLPFVYKYQFIPAKGDSLNLLVVDSIISNDEQFIELAKNHFFVYYIEKNGKQIYERDYG
ncbi:hypothetical protein [Vibrio rotiferianus]|uniref:hypothetical protein n=1 Tax=Vibrio rotiferianus TaxID=190895 RepID=UPI000577DC2E|nr:hypothetical protein [Vibrio rotiferianus]PIB16915.1 hypothetical protein B853_08222 [Vibrio rotiferianus CAIM 577 = LMG 21460]